MAINYMNLQEQLYRIKEMMGLHENEYAILKESIGVDSQGNLTNFEPSVFDELPEEIYKTLDGNYLNKYAMDFDWNKKNDEFGSPKDFNSWLKKHEEEAFLKNIDNIIRDVRQDMILEKGKYYSKKNLGDFEELMLSVFGKDIKGDALTKFEEAILLYNHSLEDIQKGFEEAKNIIDEYGNIDYTKIQKSDLFDGNWISEDKLKDYVKKNPEYQKTYNIWKKLNNYYDYFLMKDSNSFGIISYGEMKKLYDFLVQMKKSMGL
jgi:hypothetical protein